ncbi:MAG: methyltransferase domain-containing protein, partial [Candidatus Binatia bacterium]
MRPIAPSCGDGGTRLLADARAGTGIRLAVPSFDMALAVLRRSGTIARSVALTPTALRRTGRVLRWRPATTEGCTVCGATARSAILSSAAIASQLAWLEDFHLRRLTRAARERRAALEDRANFTQDEPRAIVACRSCRLVFRHPRQSADAVERTYAEDRYGETRLAGLAAAQERAYDGKIAHLRRWLPLRRRPRVVEVGSFVGGFLTAAEAEGWDALGIDPGEEVVAFCRDRALTVERGTLEDAALALASADVVAVWNTFDQIAAPGPTLTAAARVLRPGGVLAVRVPNGRYFADAMLRLESDGALARRTRLLALAWNNLIGFPYLHGYSVGTLDRLVAPYGFERLAAEPDTLLT